MKKVKLVYNSIAGQSKFTYFLDSVIEKFMQNDLEVIIYRAGQKDNLEEFLKNSDNEELYGIIVAGGDGTLNKVVTIMMKYNIKTPLGVIPAGTSNDFAVRSFFLNFGYPALLAKKFPNALSRWPIEQMRL